ncbi:DUF4129 domain-containing protein [Hyphomonas sp.]|uniref:DUF4129 domain-containing protein n=1 Tax=Hyphomonas sp. TaxID=87 RepID=UPI0035270122
MRLWLRTGIALALACLLAGTLSASDAKAQGTSDENAPHTGSIIVPPSVEPDPVFDEEFTDNEFVYEAEDWRPQTDLDALDRAHAAYIKRGDMQLERPEWEAEPLTPPDPPPQWLKWLGDLLGNLSPLFQFMFYAVIAAVVAGFLYFVFGEAIRVRFGKRGDGKVDQGDDVLVDVRPDASVARGLLEEADALALAGKFAEAVHLLLFRSIEDIQTRLEGGVPKSLTAREIGGLRNLPEQAKRGLDPIIRIVERSFFGGRAVDSEGWQAARASYEDFAFGEGWA